VIHTAATAAAGIGAGLAQLPGSENVGENRLMPEPQKLSSPDGAVLISIRVIATGAMTGSSDWLGTLAATESKYRIPE
jgi:hypothetical protein